MPTIKKNVSRIYSGLSLLDSDQYNEMMDIIHNSLPSYRYDHYRFYPAKKNNDWEKYFFARLHQLLENNEWLFFYRISNNTPYLLGCRISKWDYDHFGLKMASLHVLISGETTESEKILSALLKDCLKKLCDSGVKFISTRINGDNLPAIHVFESHGFRYYENVIWPVASCENIAPTNNIDIRLMTESELANVMDIASKNTFQRSHYHCDSKFDIQKVNLMHKNWVQTAWRNNDPIAVIESDGQIGGFFIYKFDHLLSEKMEYKYARMTNLALNSNFRSRGLGEKLFAGTMSLMKQAGAEYIDSGYSSKNHISAKLHAKYSFSSVYEEATFHLWL